MNDQQAQHTVTSQGTHKRRTGIMPLVVGASRMVRGKDKKLRQYSAREMRFALATAKSEGRELHIVCMCFDCKKTYESLEQLELDHPSDVEMGESQQAHVYGYFCEDNAEARGAQLIDALGKEIAGLRKAHKGVTDSIEKLDDYEKIMAHRKRAEEIEKTIDEVTKKRERAIENIVGILSDQAAE